MVLLFLSHKSDMSLNAYSLSTFETYRVLFDEHEDTDNHIVGAVTRKLSTRGHGILL